MGKRGEIVYAAVYDTLRIYMTAAFERVTLNNAASCWEIIRSCLKRGGTYSFFERANERSI